MRKTIISTVIVTILTALTGAIIWLCPGPDDKVEQPQSIKIYTTTTTTTTETSDYVIVLEGMDTIVRPVK